MAVSSSPDSGHDQDKKAKAKVRKSGRSAISKTLKLGREARVFTATIHYNPTYRQLDGAIHVPEGQSIPDVNRFLLDLYHGRHHIDRQRRSRAVRSAASPQKRETTPIVDGVAVKASESESQELLSGTTAVGLAECGANVGKDDAADPSLASRGHQCETRRLGHLGAESATAGTAGLQEGLEGAAFDLADRVDTLNNQDADFDVHGEPVGHETDRFDLTRNQLPDEGLCTVGDEVDLGWLELLPGVTENGPSLSDWPEMGLARTLNSGGPSEEMQGVTKGIRQRRFFELVSSHVWRAEQGRSGAEIATEAYSADPDGAYGKLRNGCAKGSRQTLRMHGTMGQVAGPNAMKLSTAAGSGVGLPMQQQVRFFHAVVLRFRRQSGAGTAPDWPSAGGTVSGAASGLPVARPFADYAKFRT
ncbi:C2H2 finger domain-containing protein [Colletotrichum limetticola]|uniref:C2H2 finger domain-containing protein n=1 Tax=Colletotrichum limetticola TaxID=1209924 RepID=A0ABQ9PBU8_9PEZI|nr:C2H2 finger domain-containing protein [Colletotrichum limetticola]